VHAPKYEVTRSITTIDGAARIPVEHDAAEWDESRGRANCILGKGRRGRPRCGIVVQVAYLPGLTVESADALAMSCSLPQMTCSLWYEVERDRWITSPHGASYTVTHKNGVIRHVVRRADGGVWALNALWTRGRPYSALEMLAIVEKLADAALVYSRTPKGREYMNSVRASGEDVEPAKPAERPKVPATLAEAIEQLDVGLPEEGRQELLDAPSLFGLGHWIRNNWLNGGTPLAIYFWRAGVHDPDEMSGLVVEAFRRHLRGERCDLATVLHSETR
jgi:hypothetical protein